jgi:hypothetical protein
VVISAAMASIETARANPQDWNGREVRAGLKRSDAPTAAGMLTLLREGTLLVGSYLIFDEEVSSIELVDLPQAPAPT